MYCENLMHCKKYAQCCLRAQKRYVRKHIVIILMCPVLITIAINLMPFNSCINTNMNSVTSRNFISRRRFSIALHLFTATDRSHFAILDSMRFPDHGVLSNNIRLFALCSSTLSATNNGSATVYTFASSLSWL